MKYFSGLLFLLIFGIKAFATSLTVTGNINGSWTADTILVEGNLSVQPGELLVIAPGTIVQFQSYYHINVMGRILAIGNEGDTILFTIRDTSNFYAQSQGRGGWSGIRFRQPSASEDSSVFSFCRFEFSKATEDSLNSYGGAIFAHNFQKLRIENCLFFHNYSFYSGGAVYLNDCDAKVESCEFVSNYSGNTGTIYGYGGGICSINSSPFIKNNRFHENSSTGVGGAVSFDNSNPVFEQNIMYNNYSALGGALGVLRSAPTHTLSNNLVTDNTALFFGGGICCIRSFPVFSNLTIANNDAAYAGGFYCNDSAVPAMYNSIIWGNTGFGSSVYIWDIYSAPGFYYCDIEGDTSGFEGSGAHEGYHGQYLENMNENPMFFGNGLFPYQLMASSPCIDGGTPDAGFLTLPPSDLAGAFRIENNRIDMGAYEFNGTTSFNPRNLKNEMLHIYPDPFIRSITITFPTNSDYAKEVVISDLQGKQIKKMAVNSATPSIYWDGCDEQGNTVTKGIYMVVVKINGKTYFGKAMKEL